MARMKGFKKTLEGTDGQLINDLDFSFSLYQCI